MRALSWTVDPFLHISSVPHFYFSSSSFFFFFSPFSVEVAVDREKVEALAPAGRQTGGGPSMKYIFGIQYRIYGIRTSNSDPELSRRLSSPPAASCKPNSHNKILRSTGEENKQWQRAKNCVHTCVLQCVLQYVLHTCDLQF